MSEGKKRCIGCMREIENAEVCPHCGFDENTPIAKDYLKPRSLLRDRYLVGKPLRYNGEGVSYIAYDFTVNAVVELREYFPDKLCLRAEDGSQALKINEGFETQYKALLIDFVELNETLVKMRTLTSLEQTYEVFEENNTAYAVREHVAGVQLAQYLQDNAGELNWSETFRLFEPLLKNIASMHGYQMLHRGISPETIRVTKHGELKLCDFSIASARNARTEISPQIYLGYAAPEQFSSSVYQGTWTDVYAVSAVLYRVLTGARPPEINNNRGFAENLLPPSVLNQTVPSPASEAIMQGLSQLTDNRTKTVGTLLSELMVAAPQDEVPLQIEETPVEKPKRYGLMALLITAGVLAVVGAGIVIFALWGTGGDESSVSTSLSESMSSSDSSTNESSSLSSSSSSGSSKSDSSSQSGSKYVMPTLTGQMYESVKNNTSYQGIITVEPTFEYSDAIPKGQIYEQDIQANTMNPANTVVKVKVSKGTRYPTVPDFNGMKKDDYTRLLDEKGIPYTYSIVTTGNFPSGTITGVSPQPGSGIDLESGTKVVITVEQ